MSLKTQSAGGVVLNKKGDVLVVSQKGTSWSLPKGHIDEGEEVLAAAKREILEEAGISQLVLLKELGTYSRHKIGKDGGDDLREYKTITMFLFTTDQTELAPQDDDNPEARWVDPAQVHDLLTHEKDKEFFRNILNELPHI